MGEIDGEVVCVFISLQRLRGGEKKKKAFQTSEHNKRSLAFHVFTVFSDIFSDLFFIFFSPPFLLRMGGGLGETCLNK